MNYIELEVPCEVRRIRECVAALHQRYPERPFTLDGKLVGDLGEVVAAAAFGLKLGVWNTAGHDAVLPDGASVEIKATASAGPNTRISFSKLSVPTSWLIILSFPPERPDIALIEYAGRGIPVWEALSKPRDQHHQITVSLRKVRSIASELPMADRLPRVLGC